VEIDPDEHVAMPNPPLLDLLGSPGGHCYDELGSPLGSHAGTAPGGTQTDREQHPESAWAAA